jgi:ssDNA thymidine ADP-ribosyltransferase, DarT
VRRGELEELHYITPITNVGSILRHGILSHRRARKLAHDSVAMAEIQERRKKVVVPGGQALHEYVNLYICARNPMLYSRSGQHDTLAVLRVSPGVLDLPGVVVADRNASSNYARFASGASGLAFVRRELVFAEYWTHPDDPIAEWEHKSIKCAEVLVPNRVAPDYIMGAYVSSTEAEGSLRAVAPAIRIELNPRLFFR